MIRPELLLGSLFISSGRLFLLQRERVEVVAAGVAQDQRCIARNDKGAGTARSASVRVLSAVYSAMGEALGRGEAVEFPFGYLKRVKRRSPGRRAGAPEARNPDGVCRVNWSITEAIGGLTGQ